MSEEVPIEGWKGIAAEIRLSLKVCRRLAWRNWDPLPVRRFQNIVLAFPTALRDWKARNTLPLQVYGRVYSIEPPPSSEGTPGHSGNGKNGDARKNKGP
jgi:hypothetical protein